MKMRDVDFEMERCAVIFYVETYQDFYVIPTRPFFEVQLLVRFGRELEWVKEVVCSCAHSCVGSSRIFKIDSGGTGDERMSHMRAKSRII